MPKSPFFQSSSEIYRNKNLDIIVANFILEQEHSKAEQMSGLDSNCPVATAHLFLEWLQYRNAQYLITKLASLDLDGSWWADRAKCSLEHTKLVLSVPEIASKILKSGLMRHIENIEAWFADYLLRHFESSLSGEDKMYLQIVIASEESMMVTNGRP